MFFETPVMRATTSAASRLGVPPATRSATARAASSSRPGTSPRSVRPIASVTSPFGGCREALRQLRGGPATTSSNSFVSSRQTATERSARSPRATRASRESSWRFERDRGVAARGRAPPTASAVTLGTGDEPDEPVPPATVAARHERGLDRGRPREAPSPRRRRRARRRSRRAPGSLTPGAPHPRRSRPARRLPVAGGVSRDSPLLVVLVVADQPWPGSRTAPGGRRCGACPRTARLGRAQLGEHAERDVLEIADRRRADRERHLYRSPSSASKPTRAAPTSPASRPSSAATTRSRSPAGVIASRRARSAAGPRTRSPAAAPKPPPTTDDSGLKMFASEPTAMPTNCADLAHSRHGRSDHRPQRPRRACGRRRPAQQGLRAARRRPCPTRTPRGARARARPDTARRRRRPPCARAPPSRGTSRPSSTIPPPTPVPSVRR